MNSPPDPSPAAPPPELYLLGRLDLRDGAGAELSAVLGQPKRLALLVYLALAPGQTLRRRDSLAALLWPEDDEEHARGSLRQAMRFLRRELGQDVVRGRGDEEIGITRELLWCDAHAFDTAVGRGELALAARCYGGDLLEGFHAADVAGEFVEWLEQERVRLRRSAAAVFGRLGEQQLAGGATADAIASLRRSVSLGPDDEATHRGLIAGLDAVGDRAGAIAAYEGLARRLRNEYGAEPSAETQAVLRRVRARGLPHNQGEPGAPAPPEAQVSAAEFQPPPAPSRSRVRIVLGALMLGILLVSGYLSGYLRWGNSLKPGSLGVAVLPVQDLTADTSRAALADGMTDELITDLAQVHGLRVINRRTMMSYQGKDAPIDSVLTRLKVDAVVTSSMQYQGDRLVFRVQLIRSGDPGAVWASSFTGGIGQMLGWQQEVARRVAEQTRIALSVAERTGLSARREVDPAALALYARGRWFWNKRGEQNLFRAIDMFKQALEVDPTYALAYSGIGDAYAQVGYGGYLAPQEAFGQARGAARKALELDSTLAEPHATLGYVAMYLDWKWPLAEQEFRHSIARSPSYATAHEWYGLFLAAMGRLREARAETKVAQELEPLSAATAATRGWVLHYSGRNEEALEVLRAAARSDSANGIVRLYLGRVHQALGALDSASAQFGAMGALRSWVPTIAGEGYVAAQQGNRVEAARVLRTLDSLSRTKYVTSYAVALVYAAMGDADQTFAWLDRAVGERTHWLVWLNRDFRWNPVRKDPRFEQLVRRIGLPK